MCHLFRIGCSVSIEAIQEVINLAVQKDKYLNCHFFRQIPSFIHRLRMNWFRLKRRFSSWQRSLRAPFSWSRSSRGHGQGQSFANTRVIPRQYGFRCSIRTTERCFTSDPRCNLNPDDLTPSLHGYDYSRRQGSGEEFSSEGPAECRTTLCPP